MRTEASAASSTVEAGESVTASYTRPQGPHFIRDTQGNIAFSFTGRQVVNQTAAAEPEDSSERTAPANPERTAAPLTASVHDAPEHHDGSADFGIYITSSEDIDAPRNGGRSEK